ncbi:MAG: hypothetical protein DRJ42_06000 [Deltaproteobacteria bacterium]|nr:MAG: hypothetical protein DRJ42_06000 [Deltaproteobacteria bacterium]
MLLCATAVVCATTGCHYYGDSDGQFDGDAAALDGSFCPPDADDPHSSVVVDGADASSVDPDAAIADSGAAPDGEPDGGGEGGRLMHCEHDGQCGGGVCIDMMCHRACSTGDECGTGHGCIDGLCDFDPTAAVECALSGDCGDGGVCIDGACHTSCAVDTECADPDDFCDHGLCRPDFRPITECATRAHCEDGLSCVNGLCRLACWADDECASGTCQGGFCSE